MFTKTVENNTIKINLFMIKCYTLFMNEYFLTRFYLKMTNINNVNQLKLNNVSIFMKIFYTIY